jgi:hypothetical protein
MANRGNPAYWQAMLESGRALALSNLPAEDVATVEEKLAEWERTASLKAVALGWRRGATVAERVRYRGGEIGAEALMWHVLGEHAHEWLGGAR